MPYTHKKVGDQYVVYKGGKKVGATKGTKEALKKYLAALHIADEKTKKEESKSLKEAILATEEPQMEMNPMPQCEDEVGKIFVVLKPHPDMPAQDMVQPTDVFGASQYESGNVHGVYLDDKKAHGIAERLVREMHVGMAKLEEKKAKVSDKLQRVIGKLQKELNKHMSAATTDPKNADMHQSKAEELMNQIKGLRHKHKMVETSRKQLPAKEEE